MVRKIFWLLPFFLFSINAFSSEGRLIQPPSLIIEGVAQKFYLQLPDSVLPAEVLVNGITTTLQRDESGVYFLKASGKNERSVSLSIKGFNETLPINPMPGWLSIIPPLLAILLALLFKEVISALFMGALSGALISGYYVSSVKGLLGGFFTVTDALILDVLSDRDHLSIIVFTLMIGAMVAIIAKNGGMHGLAERVARFASNRRRGQLSTYFLGIVVFFDDYTNTLIVGNTMRPLTDRLKISREKLAYLVDSTAAPVVSIAFVTTWIGAQLGYIESGIDQIDGYSAGAYEVFLNSLQYAYYPIFTLAFMLMVAWSGRDFGPMLRAEQKAALGENDISSGAKLREAEEMEPSEHLQKHAYMALIPILVLLFSTMAGLWITGTRELQGVASISEILGASNSYIALLWGSFSALAVAGAMSIGGRFLTLMQVSEAIVTGFKFMLNAIIILVFAWVLADITAHLHTADFIAGSMLGSGLNPHFVPALTFLAAAAIAFSTGSSWSTMAILYPIILPLSWAISSQAGLESAATAQIFFNVVSCVLAGSVLGDHCSPISDTTILSSLASGCDHLGHVRTQMPYALSVGAVSLIIGTLPAAFGLPWYLLMPLGITVLGILLTLKGKILSHE